MKDEGKSILEVGFKEEGGVMIATEVLGNAYTTRNTLKHEVKHVLQARDAHNNNELPFILTGGADEWKNSEKYGKRYEQEAIDTQKAHDSYKDTPEWYKKKVNDYEESIRNRKMEDKK